MVHRKKLILASLMILVVLAVIPLMSANYYSIENDLDLKLQESSCNSISIFYPNGTILIDNQTMSNYFSYSNYTISSSSLIGGTYQYYSDCGSGTFEVNNNGIEPTQARATLNAAMMFLLVLLFILCVWLMLRMENYKRDVEGEILGINQLKYIKFPLFTLAYGILMGIFYIASNIGFGYLGDELFAQIFFTLFTIMMKLYIVILLVVTAWFFFQIVQDKKISGLIERGVDINGGGL